MIADYYTHLLLVGGGMVLSKVLRSAWEFFSKAFGIGFKEGLATRIRLGRELTDEEKAQMEDRIQKKLAEKLIQD